MASFIFPCPCQSKLRPVGLFPCFFGKHLTADSGAPPNWPSFPASCALGWKVMAESTVC
jgi:hypothetical protein